MIKKILALHTGGTISMQADASGAVVTNSSNPMNHVDLSLAGIELTSEDFLNLPSPHVTPQHMLHIHHKIF